MLLQQFPDIEHVFLRISEGAVFQIPTAVQTVLGSCVAVTFFDPVFKLGSIFHALLPLSGDFLDNPGERSPYRYVDTSIELCLSELARRGIDQKRLEIKLFGGANQNFKRGPDIGAQNVAAALATLDKHGLAPIASNTGGPKGRKLLFLSHTGEIYLKMLNVSVRQ